MPDILDEVLGQLGVTLSELKRRVRATRKADSYYDGCAPIPTAVRQARMTNAYGYLMGMSDAPWGSLVVDSVQDRLEASGIRTGDAELDKTLWGIWQDNAMDAESKLAHNAALRHGRSFAMVWPGENELPEIQLESADQMIVLYRPGSRRHRVAALRSWIDFDNREYATLYRPEGFYRFRRAKDERSNGSRFKVRVCEGDEWWEPYAAADEEWPAENPYGVVPVVEVPVNRRLQAGHFPYARGEFEHCFGLLDRIQLLTFLGLVVAVWMGFPLRGVLGQKVLKDDDGNPIAPFNSDPGMVFQFESTDASIAEFKAADRKNLAIYQELDQLATVTKTPRHYFPLEQGMSNIAADTIRANEGSLHAKVSNHKASLGEAHEEILRLAGLMHPGKLIVPSSAELVWKDHESRSLAERADAAVKLASIQGLPWQATAEIALNLSQDQIGRYESMGQAQDLFNSLLIEAQAPPVVPEVVT